MPEAKECANCGATQGLLKCSRCQQAYFCSWRCQKAYWPFHKSECRRNDFADAIAKQEPKFAAWMRKHGKIAVLKDDEVDRLERASAATHGATREDVMASMYGRADPKPLPPTYSPEDLKKMRAAEETAHLTCGRVPTPTDRAWAEIGVAEGLGLDCGAYKWSQTQAQVEVFIRLPRVACSRRHVDVDLTPTSLRVRCDGETLLEGALFREIKRDESTWLIHDGAILELSLLKRFRRGLAYGKGETNADTFWRSLLQNADDTRTLLCRHPPSAYYKTEWRTEAGGGLDAAARPRPRPHTLTSADGGAIAA